MSDQSRLEIIAKLLKGQRVRNQLDLQQQLDSMGIATTQSSISRDLKKMGVIKIDGRYRPPQIAPGESKLVDSLTANSVGDNLIVVKTGPGNAGRAAFLIDSAKISGIMGTIAGDDTIFLAVSSRNEQTRILKKMFSLFAERENQWEA